MKIAFLGNFGVEYCSEVHYKKTFEKLGHEILPYQEGQHIFTNVEIDTILGCDMFFWVHTHGWSNIGLSELLGAIKGKVPVIGYHLDLWLGIEREKDLHNDSYWSSMDYFFSVDQLMVDWLNERHNKGEKFPKAFFLPAGVFEDECYLGEKRPEFEHDVIFVGSRGYHPEWPYRKQLIEWLEQTYGGRFAQYGGGGRGTIRGKDLNDLYASAKVVVGDTLCKGFDYPYYLSDRIFETTGRGGFIIHPYIKGMEDLFRLRGTCDNLTAVISDSPEIITYAFNDFEYLKSAIAYYLKHEEERQRIQLAGHKRTKKDHTYTQRLTKLLEIVNKEKCN